ncbi:methylenetetrahydrofolate reductase [Fructilactobacillus hinvesii]|uniref:Methylenetetrahydrofolate reductase n=1 Tax=Fructilactobacillus hinvesii TaxID=2940300 RepID=A0ABY5BT07_9LACO|nr:methylenetetrahydrofolate reductase [Fructilactobacillus hinvesii]USS88065.1 methylenetetrahydrofolate reductase [Fructilactobacillus hinvesii]
MTPPFGIEVSPLATPIANQNFLEASGLGTELRPDFVSVTWGVGGQTNSSASLDLLQALVREQISVIPHLTGLYKTPMAVRQELQELERIGITKVLALRGDQNDWQTPTGYFPHATNLIQFIDQHSQLKVGAAAYPERHPESSDWGTELFYLRAKVQAGAQFFMTQFCFDLDKIFSLVERLRDVEIQVPVVVGVLPLTSTTRVHQAEAMLGHSLPDAIQKQLQATQTAAEFRQVGINLALAQIHKLQQFGLGVQLYSFNDLELIQTILQSLN